VRGGEGSDASCRRTTWHWKMQRPLVLVEVPLGREGRGGRQKEIGAHGQGKRAGQSGRRRRTSRALLRVRSALDGWAGKGAEGAERPTILAMWIVFFWGSQAECDERVATARQQAQTEIEEMRRVMQMERQVCRRAGTRGSMWASATEPRVGRWSSRRRVCGGTVESAAKARGILVSLAAHARARDGGRMSCAMRGAVVRRVLIPQGV